MSVTSEAGPSEVSTRSEGCDYHWLFYPIEAMRYTSASISLLLHSQRRWYTDPGTFKSHIFRSGFVTASLTKGGRAAGGPEHSFEISSRRSSRLFLAFCGVLQARLHSGGGLAVVVFRKAQYYQRVEALKSISEDISIWEKCQFPKSAVMPNK